MTCFDDPFAEHLSGYLASIIADYRAERPQYGTAGYLMTAGTQKEILTALIAHIGTRDRHHIYSTLTWNAVHELGALCMNALAWSYRLPDEAIAAQLRARLQLPMASQFMMEQWFLTEPIVGPVSALYTLHGLMAGEIVAARVALGVDHPPSGCVAIEQRLWALLEAICVFIGEVTYQAADLKIRGEYVLRRGGEIMAAGYDRALIAYHVDDNDSLLLSRHVQLIRGIDGPVIGIIDDEHLAVEVSLGRLMGYVRAKMEGNTLPIAISGLCAMAPPIPTKARGSVSESSMHIVSMATELIMHGDDE